MYLYTQHRWGVNSRLLMRLVRITHLESAMKTRLESQCDGSTEGRFEASLTATQPPGRIERAGSNARRPCPTEPQERMAWKRYQMVTPLPLSNSATK